MTDTKPVFGILDRIAHPDEEAAILGDLQVGVVVVSARVLVVGYR